MTAVTNVSFVMKPGRVLGLVGESGCGKTLTAQSILRLGEHQGIQRLGGSILLDGQDIFSMRETQLQQVRGGRIGMVFQEPMTALNPVFSIGDQITEVIRLHMKLSREKARLRAVQLLQDVGLQDTDVLLKQYPDSLSGGMRQRVLIAMAMSVEPDYIIADEPTTALDVSVQSRIILLLKKLQRERGLGMLLVTHDFGLVAELADEVAVMYAGHIVEYGSVTDIFDQSAHPYTRALMNCRPETSERGKAMPVISGQVPAPGAWPQGCRFAPRCPMADGLCVTAIRENDWKKNTHWARCVHVDSTVEKT
ncbi:MAG: ABC transporter ATP-binding protein [Mariprofundaceae bacterium]